MSLRTTHFLNRLSGILLVMLMAVCALPAQGVETTSASRITGEVNKDDSTAVNKPVRHRRTQVVMPKEPKDSVVARHRVQVVNIEGDTLYFSGTDSLKGIEGEVRVIPDSVLYGDDFGRFKPFNPDPTRALWLSALCPGLGQIYNRRYWKLPIVVGAFVGLSYGMSWNNRMYHDYTKAYRDITDNDPNTRSYMNFYPSTVKEEDLDITWLTKALKSKKDYYRRYREICVFSMVGVYLLSILDAYVDASLAHFDVSPDLSMRLRPAILNQGFSAKPSLGMQCAFSF